MNRVRFGYAAAARNMDYYEYNVRICLALLYPPQALVKDRADVRRPTLRVDEKVVKNKEEDEGLETLASDTMRRPLDSAPIDLAAWMPRNLLPCSGEISQGELWNRTADWRTLLRQRPAGEGQAGAKQLSLVLESSLRGGFIRDTTQPLVQPTCGSCGQKREPRHKVDIEPGLLSTHHPTAAPLNVRLFSHSLLLVSCVYVDQHDSCLAHARASTVCSAPATNDSLLLLPCLAFVQFCFRRRWSGGGHAAQVNASTSSSTTARTTASSPCSGATGPGGGCCPHAD